MAGFFSPEKMMEGLQSLGSLGKVVEPMPRNATQQKVDEEMKVRGFETLKDGATEEEFAKIFGMKEPLLMWYHASLRTQYNFLLQGKLYFTESFVGFHSYFTDSVTNFGEDTIVMLEHHSIKEVVKTTHLMIPASIEILQHNGTIFHIASLAQRDKTADFLDALRAVITRLRVGKREAPTKFPGKPNVFNFQGMFAALPSKEEGASPSAKPPTATSPTTTAPPAAKPSPTQPSAIKPTPPTPTPAPTQPPAPKPQPTQPPAAKPQPTQPPKVQPNTFPPVAKAQPTTPPPGPKAQPGTTPATKVQPTAPPSSSGGVVSLGSISMGPKPGEEAKIVKKPAMDLEDGVKYEGEWKGGKKHGKGLQIWPDGKRYEGQFENGLACGKGKFTFKNGDTYDGMWRDDKAHGNGVYTTKEGDRYDGSWHADNKHGKAKETFADGSKFIGVYNMGVKEGRGVFHYSDGASYDGEFATDEPNGWGVYKWDDGRAYFGQWKNGEMHGYGKYVWPDKRYFEGQYVADEKEGYGLFSWPDGKQYNGAFSKNKQHGLGTYRNQQKQEKSGEWADGVRVRWLEEKEMNQLPTLPKHPATPVWCRA